MNQIKQEAQHTAFKRTPPLKFDGENLIYQENGPTVLEVVYNPLVIGPIIVNAFNSHYELIEALRELKKVAFQEYNLPMDHPVYQQARQALSKAEGR